MRSEERLAVPIQPLYDRLQGVHVLAITPMASDRSIDFEGLEANLEHFLARGADGVIVGGTYAEFPSLRREERIELFHAAARAVVGRVPLICCTASSSTLEAIELGQEAAAAGADGVMVTPPYVSEVRPSDVLHHFREVARNSGLPILAYNSQSIGVGLSPEEIIDLAEIDGIVGVKQGALDPRSQVTTVARAGDRLRIMCGSDGAILSALAHGMAGVTTTLANFMIDEVLSVHRDAMAGDWDRARRTFYGWQELRDFAFTRGQPVVTKAAMDLIGLAAGPPRPPFRSLDRADVHTLRDVLKKANLVQQRLAS